MTSLHGFLFGVYPYICLTVFLLGSLLRFDREQYSWKSDSSQLLRTGLLRWGSNLFHFGILFLFFGHLVGLLAPHAFYGHFMDASVKQRLAIYAGGIAGTICFVGLSMLIYRRIFDERIRYTSHKTDLAILLILWIQLVVGLITLPFSWSHSDGSVMLILADWAQRILTLREVNAEALWAVPWPYLFLRLVAAAAVHAVAQHLPRWLHPRLRRLLRDQWFNKSRSLLPSTVLHCTRRGSNPISIRCAKRLTPNCCASVRLRKACYPYTMV